MSVEFSNAYQEILLDNFNSVIKQNIMFQTQLKMAEEAQKNNKSEDKINLLNGEYNILKTEYDAALRKIAELEPRANVGQSLHDEKTRIQSALNEEMRKNVILREEVNQKSAEIEEQKKKIADCENELVTKNKEIEELNSILEKKESIMPKVKKTNSKIDMNNVADGGSF